MRHQRIDANGIGLHIVDHGTGPVVLFVHGFPDIWSSWRSQMSAVAAAGWRAIAIDLRGCGASDAPEGIDSYTLFETIGDLVVILDRLRIETAILVGHDLGAIIAWNAAMMRPDRFTAVFGISIPFRQPGRVIASRREAGAPDFDRLAHLRPGAEEAWADAAVTIPGAHYWGSAQAPADMRWHLSDRSRGLLRPAPSPLRNIDLGYIEEAVECFTRTGFRAALTHYRAIKPFSTLASRAYAGAIIAQPSFFVTGALDAMNEVLTHDELAMRRALPALRGVLTVGEAGHWPHLEAPRLLNAQLLSFLASL